MNDTMFDGEPVVVFEGNMLVKTLRDNLHPDMPWGLQPDKALVDDIKNIGVHTPIVIEEVNEKYWIRAGKRRFLASEQLGLFNIPCVVRQYPLGMGAVVGLSTNVKRSNNPVDEYHHMMELKAYLQAQEKWVSDESLAKQLGISITQYRKISCVGIMPEPVQTAINDGRITINNAYALAKLPPSKQEPLVEFLADGNRVTGKDIKNQKRVIRSETTTDLLPTLELSSNGNSHLPKRNFVDTAVKNLLGDIPLTSTNRDKLVDFVFGMMENPTRTLEKVLGE